ncbi:MAG: proprotein convertase P-domain-containing protein [Myxococcota bacterium]|nr:proprotein convertase P-domain-containing protein [Myxococcota bacterium]
MKRSLLAGLGLTLLGSLQLAGCATSEEDAGDECLPGDIDCSTDDGGDGGKGDGFDYKNDPARMSQRLVYTLSELPKKGDLKTPTWKDRYPDAVGRVPVAWADTYWPTYNGSHNARWQGSTSKSPLEKYDQAFNNAQGCATMPANITGAGSKAAWDTYYGCAGPATKWQSKEFQGGGDMHDGIDNDGDGVTDDRGPNGDVDGIATWWGTCHAWAPASLVVPEPQKAVTVNGVKFEVADVKALVQNAYDSTAAVMLGGRCNSKEIMHSVTGSANDACSDLNPGGLHVIMTNFLGVAQLPLVEDRTANYEVWNQPVVGYEVTQQNEVTAKVANTCVGATGDTWKYNTAAKKLFDVKMTVKYVTEGDAEARPLGFANFTRTDNYHYILELNSVGKIIGGRYCTDSTNSHVDFLWSPTGNHNPTNPYVKSDKVNELVAKSIARDGGGGTPTGQTFSATPNAAIPDNNPTGVSADLTVAGVTGSLGLTVSLDITHTYKGDLKVTLLKNGTQLKVLHDRTGGSVDNIVQSYTLTAAEVGAANARYTIKVVDTAGQDTGTLNKFSLTFQ